MSSAPARTHSIRKPVAKTGFMEGFESTASVDSTSMQGVPGNQASDRRTNRSPSRLPAASTSGHSRTGSVSHNVNGSMRPPPPRAPLSRPPLTSDNSRGFSIRSGARTPTETVITSSRPPSTSDNSRGLPIRSGARTPTDSVITSSRPPQTSDNRSFSVRSGARTPTDPPTSNNSLQRRPSSSRSGHTRQTSTTAASTTARPSSTSHVRSNSLLTSSSSSTILRPPSQTGQTSSASQRPAFSTLQQHYTPQKSAAPKPLTSTFLAPPSPSKAPSALALSAEVAKLQTELLQLHLLHRTAADVEAEYRASAKRKLGARFRETRGRWDDLIALEGKEQQRVNLEALRSWLDGGVPGWDVQEKVHLLGEVVTGVWNMSESGGKYARVVKRFERWFRKAQQILAARETGGIAGSEVICVERVDEGWAEECAVLRRKLEGWKVALKDPGRGVRVARRSSLAAVLGGFAALVDGMLEELEVMGRVERDVVAAEREWVREMIEGDDDDDVYKGEVRGPAWRIT